jgi:hypothetical protein
MPLLWPYTTKKGFSLAAKDIRDHQHSTQLLSQLFMLLNTTALSRQQPPQDGQLLQ